MIKHIINNDYKNRLAELDKKDPKWAQEPVFGAGKLVAAIIIFVMVSMASIAYFQCAKASAAVTEISLVDAEGSK